MAGSRPTSPSKHAFSGLPPQDPYRDIHMDTAKAFPAGLADIRMNTAKGVTLTNDIRMETARGNNTFKGGFQLWEKELLESSEVRRKATVAQLCELRLVGIDPKLLAVTYIIPHACYLPVRRSPEVVD